MGMKVYTLENEAMNVKVYFSSDCCGFIMTAGQAEYGICPQCGEHCEVVVEEVSEDTGEY